jgi:hypothetical protein
MRCRHAAFGALGVEIDACKKAAGANLQETLRNRAGSGEFDRGQRRNFG